MHEEKLPAEEVSRRAKELYERDIRPNLGDEHTGEYIAVDARSGDYETADNVLDATRALRGRRPDAVTYLMRIGSDGAAKAGYKFGGRGLAGQSQRS